MRRLRRTIIGGCALATVSVASAASAVTVVRPSLAVSSAVYVACFPNDTRIVPQQHPKKCTTYGIPADSASETQLIDARWTKWSAPTTSVSGRVLPNNPGMGGPSLAPVKYKFTRIEKGCGGRRFYTELEYPGNGALPAGSFRIYDACKLGDV